MRECSPLLTCHLSSVMYHMSCVTSHMSRVTCQLSHVNCHMSFYYYFFLGHSGKDCRWRVCYQRGLSRLVFHLKSCWCKLCGIYNVCHTTATGEAPPSHPQCSQCSLPEEGSSQERSSGSQFSSVASSHP